MLETKSADVDKVATLAAQLNRINNVRLYDDAGIRYEYSERSEPITVSSAIVQDVLNGKTYSSRGDARTVQTPGEDDRPIVGLPFELEGKKFAFFITPSFFKQINDFESIRNRILMPVLITSGFMILVVSRYLVRPLKKMTEATKRMAKGDFDVQLSIKQKDELGELANSINYMAGELEKMELTRKELISNVSHDIQTPLTSIRGFSKLLQKDDLPDDERRSYLQIIETESERLSRLSENMLRLSSLESDRLELQRTSYHLDEQLRQVVVASEPLCTAKGLDIELELPSTRINADFDALSQVWSNLLSNSIKFTPYGGSVRIAIEEETDRLRVEFADTGIGISQEEQRNIFQRFYKVDASRQTTAGSGSGLGLAIVKKIVVLHGGSIELRSELGRGTSIAIILPKA